MADPSWQEALRLRLIERDAKESAFAPVIDQYRRLAQQTKILKERNNALLRAADLVKANPASNAASSNDPNQHPVRNAYLAGLESQIATMRDELNTIYKTQSQNTQRLLAMTETLREKEDLARQDAANLEKANAELASLRKKVAQHTELMQEKDRTVQILHDEISTLQLELGQIEERNQNLQRDNAKLLQRWLDAKQVEANRMNEANEFYEDMRSRHQASLDQNGTSSGTGVDGNADSSSSSGKGEPKVNHQPPLNPDMSTPPMPATVSLTPNG